MAYAYVTADGNYGGDDIILFEASMLHGYQWEILSEMVDRDRLPYIAAIMAGNKKLIKQIEKEYA